MPRKRTRRARAVEHDLPFDKELQETLKRLTCACLDASACCGRPQAQALFWKVEVDGQTVEAAAAALGLEAKAARTILYEIRRDVAEASVCTLGIADEPHGSRHAKGHCCTR